MSDVTIEGFRWAAIPEDLLYDSAISPEAVRVYGVLLRHGTDPSSCYPSHRRIGQLIGRSMRSVPRWIRELEVAGWVHVEPRTSTQGDPDSNGYRVFDHAQASAGVPADPRTPLPAGQRGGYAPASAPNDSQVNDSQVNEGSGPAAPTTDSTLFEVPTEVEALCTELADAIAGYRDGAQGGRPEVTKRWRDDMRLLLERGPLGTEAHPLRPENVRGCIAVVFREMAEPEGSGTFCWAAQVQSPQALRRHWWKIRDAAKRRRDTLRHGKLAAVGRQVNGGQDLPDLGQVLAEHHQTRQAQLAATYGTAPALGAGQ